MPWMGFIWAEFIHNNNCNHISVELWENERHFFESDVLTGHVYAKDYQFLAVKIDQSYLLSPHQMSIWSNNN